MSKLYEKIKKKFLDHLCIPTPFGPISPDLKSCLEGLVPDKSLNCFVLTFLRRNDHIPDFGLENYYKPYKLVQRNYSGCLYDVI